MPAVSFWMQALGAVPRRPSLRGRRDADVCIVGGGFTGLWTAYELRRAEPSLDVVVLEAEQVGFGASGRNGGWVLGVVSGSPAAWRRRAGGEPDAPRRMSAAIQATVDEVGAAVSREGIDCDWVKAGSMTVAQTKTELERLRSALAGERAWAGVDCAWTELEAAQVLARVGVAGARGGLYTPACARVQPAKLVRGLAEAAERRGAVIHEDSRAVALAPGRVTTAFGQVRAERVIVAVEGYTADLPGRRRALLPLNSSMLVTEPLPEALWAQIGWEGSETLLDGAHAYCYLQRTADGRIAIGGRGVPYRFGSRTDREGPVPGRTVRELRERLVGLFPAVEGVPVARAWHGVLGVARDWCPSVVWDGGRGLGWAGGYAGDGVAASNLAGRTLRDLVLGADSELTRLPWVGQAPRCWEPEPLRFLGARGVYALYRAADRRERARDRPSRLASLASAVAGR